MTKLESQQRIIEFLNEEFAKIKSGSKPIKKLN
jgi:hypothetical protein